MARSKLTETTSDLVTDSGAVLWSFVKGEQLEYPVTLAFVSNAGVGYTYEAVVIEADNVVGQTDRPVAVKQGGVQTTLNIRVPTDRGTWQGVQAYNRNEVVYHNGKYYILLSGAGYVSAINPADDPRWAEYTPNVIYIQFPSTLAAAWAVQPGVASAVYGFFELRVTEPSNAVFQRTWKPVRGMVQILFSPTDVVP